MKKIIICILFFAAISVAFALTSFCEAENKAPVKQKVDKNVKKVLSDLRQKIEKKQQEPAVKAQAAVVKKEEMAPIQAQAAVVGKEAVPAAGTVVPEAEKMTKKEMIEELNDLLDGDDEVIDVIQGLEASKDVQGKLSYTYKGLKLEDVNEDELRVLLIQTHQTMTRIRTERIQRQLEAVRRVERIQAMSRPTAPPVPPVALGAPRMPPRIPSAPPRAASAPSSPPSLPPNPSRR